MTEIRRFWGRQIQFLHQDFVVRGFWLCTIKLGALLFNCCLGGNDFRLWDAGVIFQTAAAIKLAGFRWRLGNHGTEGGHIGFARAKFPTRKAQRDGGPINALGRIVKHFPA
jgi:hypothetical protein